MIEDTRAFDVPAMPAQAPGRRLTGRLMASLATAGALLVADQLTKWLALTQVRPAPDQSIAMLGEVVRFTFVANRGAAFGILQEQTLFFIVVSVGVIGVIGASYRYFPAHGLVLNLALGLQLGGALGNLLDRVRLGFVVDFIDVAIWPVFNLADAGIVVGVGVLAYRLLRSPRAPRVRSDG